MASINDFKLVNIKSKKYFDLMKSEINFDSDAMTEKEKERYGFYPYMLESICGIKDISDLINLITDTDFNASILNKGKFEDHGIDAIYIKEDDHTINLFNFKFREKFNSNKKQSINETIISIKFINALINDEINHLDGLIKDYAKTILSKLNSNDIWKLNLYIISNETVELNKDDVNLKQLEKLYDLEIIPFGLSRIKEIMSIRPEPISASLILNTDAVMSYSESSISSSKSYIIRLLNSEVIRITSNNKETREKYNIEDITTLATENLDFSVLFDNVRGFVQKSKYNQNIESSLKEESSKFFMYNNGITIIADNIDVNEVNAGKRVKLSINNFQVLNGGQTLRTLHKFNQLDKNHISDYLSKSEILVRVFTTSDEYINKIAEFTNSQNSISNVDLKSLSSEQIELEQYLDEYNIIYARKSGDTGLSESKIYSHKISMEKFGQILFSILGSPEKATNQKKQIFDKYYTDIFGVNNLNISNAPKQIETYFEIKNIYSTKKEIQSNDQKIFYILYMLEKVPSKSIDELIELLESIILKYQPIKEQSHARKLIQTKFKELLDSEILDILIFDQVNEEFEDDESKGGKLLV